MAYIGHSPSTGEDNNFKILDDISSYTLTFDGSSSSVVSTSDETIYSYNHRFVQGQRVTYNNGGGGNIAGLTSGTVYYIIKQDHNNIQLATSASNATAGTAINITAVGTGASHTLNVAFDGTNTKFKATHTTGQKARITRGAQLVLSVNGVIQQPHDSSTPSTGFGFDVDGTIIFSEAPASTDAFWGHILTNNNVTFDISDNKIDHFTGNGSTLAFTLSKSPPNNENILVTIDGVVQYPNDSAGNIRAYSVAANVISFTSAPGSGTAIEVRHIGFAGATSGGGVTGFYGRTGNAVLKSTDHITTGNIVAGVVTATSAVITGDLTVNGTTTTLDTDLIGVDKIEVAANNTTVAVAVTQSGAGDLVRLFDSTTEKLRITDDGLVGIGTINPTNKLHLCEQGNDSVSFKMQNNEGATTIQADGDAFHIDAGSHYFRNAAGTANRIVIASNGRVGITSTVPTAPLNIQAETSTGVCLRLNQEPTDKRAYIQFQDYATTGVDSYILNEGYDLTVYGGYNGKLNLGAYNKTGITVRSTGKVGVGTEDPSNALDVQGGTTNTAIVARSTDAKAQVSLLDNSTTSVGCVVLGAEGDDLFLTSGSGGLERLRIDSVGMTGVRTTVPRATLHVKAHDNNWEGGLLLEDNTGSDGWNLHPESNDASILFGYNDNTAAALTDQTASVVLKLKSDGNVLIGSFTPVDTRNTGGIHIQPNKGISFKAHSSTPSRNWRIRNDDAAWGNLDFGVGTSNSDFADAGSEIVLSLTNSRRVGIGIVSPDSLLHLEGSGDTAKIKFQRTGTTIGGSIQTRDGSNDKGLTYIAKDGNSGYPMHVFQTDAGSGATERLRIFSDGDVGIGTDTMVSDSKVHLWDGSTSNYRPIVIDSAATNGSTLVYRQLGTQVISIGSGGGNNLSGSSVTHGLIRSEVATVFAVGNSEKLRIDSSGDLFARADSTVYLVLGSSGDATSGGANNNMNWIRGNSTNLQYNCNGGYHAWENVGGEKMKLNGQNLELRSTTQCRITLGNAGTAGNNDSNWIRGDGNYMMLNSATSDGHIFECAGTAKAKINPTLGVRAENTCKAWVSYRSEAGSEGIIDDFYVSSVVDEATGTFFVNLDGDIGVEDGVSYIFGSHNDGARPLQAVIAYTPSHGSMNPWWTMEDDGTRVNVMRADNNTKVDGEWFSMAAFADAI